MPRRTGAFRTPPCVSSPVVSPSISCSSSPAVPLRKACSHRSINMRGTRRPLLSRTACHGAEGIRLPREREHREREGTQKHARRRAGGRRDDRASHAHSPSTLSTNHTHTHTQTAHVPSKWTWPQEDDDLLLLPLHLPRLVLSSPPVRAFGLSHLYFPMRYKQVLLGLVVVAAVMLLSYMRTLTRAPTPLVWSSPHLYGEDATSLAPVQCDPGRWDRFRGVRPTASRSPSALMGLDESPTQQAPDALPDLWPQQPVLCLQGDDHYGGHSQP